MAYEFLPGQYDQRADSAMQCLMLLNNKQTVRIHSGTLLVFLNPVDEETLNKITHYIVNPVEARVKDLSVLVDDQDVEVKRCSCFRRIYNKDERRIRFFTSDFRVGHVSSGH